MMRGRIHILSLGKRATSGVILAEVTYAYTSPAGEVIYGQISFSDTFYVRPRRVQEVARVN